MKTLLLMLTMSSMTIISSQNENSDKTAIEQVITAFTKAGDEQNADQIDAYLHQNYRIVMNQLFGSPGVVIMSKEQYVKKIRSKEFGGDSRKITFQHIEINGNTAMVKVLLKGEQMTLSSIFSLVKDQNNNWKLISDLPVVI